MLDSVDYVGANRRKEQWHLKKELNISHLLTTAGAICTAAFFISRQDTRIALIEQSMAAQANVDERQDIQARELKVELKELLTDIKLELRELRKQQQERK